MKSYYLTQEQALEIAKSIGLSPITHGISDSVAKPILKDFANAVLDQVLGEPVAEVEVRKNRVLTNTLMQVTTPIADGRHKLYAPKEQS